MIFTTVDNVVPIVTNNAAELHGLLVKNISLKKKFTNAYM